MVSTEETFYDEYNYFLSDSMPFSLEFRGLKKRVTDRRTDRWTDRWTDRRTDQRTDQRTNGQTLI